MVLVLEDLLNLSDAEKALRELYIKHSQLHQDTPKTLKQWSEKEAFQQYKDILNHYFSDINLLMDHYSENLFKSTEDVILFMHQRYFPCFLHYHEFFEITYVINGKYQVFINDKLLELSKGDICILAPNVWHCPKTHLTEDLVCDILVRSSTFDKVFFHILDSNPILSTFFARALTIPNGGSYLKFSTKDDCRYDYVDLSLLSSICRKS